MQQRVNVPDPVRPRREAAHRARAARRRLAWRFHLGRARPPVGGAELGNRGHQRHQRRRHECGGSRRWPAPRRSLAGASWLCSSIGRMSATCRDTRACGHWLRSARGTSTTIPLYLWADMLTRVWSPYQINRSNYHPLRELLQRIDFEGLRDDACAPRVFICATNVRTGLRRVFHNAELSVDVLLASACLPQALSSGPDRGRLLLGWRLHRKPGARPPLPRHERHRSDRRGHQSDGAHDRAADGARHHRPHRRDQLQLDLHAGARGDRLRRAVDEVGGSPGPTADSSTCMASATRR